MQSLIKDKAPNMGDSGLLVRICRLHLRYPVNEMRAENIYIGNKVRAGVVVLPHTVTYSDSSSLMALPILDITSIQSSHMSSIQQVRMEETGVYTPVLSDLNTSLPLLSHWTEHICPVAVKETMKSRTYSGHPV